MEINWIVILFGAACILFAWFIISKIVRNVSMFWNRITNPFRIIEQVSRMVEEANDVPQKKSIGGNTRLYLERIQADFPDFHNPEAERAIDRYIQESVINSDCENYEFHQIAIYHYKKTQYNATITYRCAVGFSRNGNQVETRYEVDYTLKLKDEYGVSQAMECPNCGGPYSATNKNVCLYCDTPILRDTYLNWTITKCKEI